MTPLLSPRYFCPVKKYAGYIAYFVYWLLFFIITRALFLVYNHSLTAGLSTSEISKVFIYGLRMDVSFTSYICIFPFLLFFLRSFIIKFRAEKIIRIFTISVVVLLTFLATVDCELYRAWGYRMDITPLQYFKSPREMGSSMYSSPLLLLLAIFIALSALFTWIYRKCFEKYIYRQPVKFSAAGIVIQFLLVILLFIPIRGVIQK